VSASVESGRRRHPVQLVGVIHLPPLLGSPRSRESTRACAVQAARCASALVRAGFDGIILENFNDAPFFAGTVPPVTVAAMTACALAVRDAAPELYLGVNVLRNDAEAALAVAACVEAEFVRVNVLTGVRVADQGIIEGKAATLLRASHAWAQGRVRIWADVDVKHSAPLGPARPLAQEVEDTVHRALADAVLVTGDGTGKGVDVDKLSLVARAAGEVPVYVASGATPETLAVLAQHATGVIVGSALRTGGRPGGPVDEALATSFAQSFRRAFAK